MVTVDVCRKHSFGNEIVKHSVEERGILGVKAQLGSPEVEGVAL
jgi:hypothetical protein